MALGAGFQVIAPSRFGYLRSTLPQQPSLARQAAAYRELLDRLHIERVVVLGSSAGGPSAMQFANDYPERTAALILVSAVSEAPAPGDKPAFYIGVIHLIQQSDYAYWLLAKGLQSTLLNLMGIPPGVYASFTPAQRQLAQEMLDTMHPMSQRYRGTVNDGEMIQRETAATARIAAPALILHAKDDALVGAHHAQHSRAAIRTARLVLFETGGHGLLPQLDAVRRETGVFLKTKAAPRP
jgi:pimeloyl-ACP methyl ester carboxylesterase